MVNITSKICLLPFDFFYPIQECHMVFFLTPARLEFDVRGLPKSDGLRRIAGGSKKASPMVVEAVWAAWGEVVLALSVK